MSITELSIKRPTLAVVLFSALSFFGLFSYFELPYELLPELETPVINITTVYPGASPEEVETSVTKEVEDAVSTMENVDKLRAISLENVSVVIVELNYGANVDLSVQEAQRKVDAIIAELPDEAEEPSIEKLSLDELPIMRLGATADMDPTAFTDLMQDQIQPELSRISGVANIEIVGGEEREIRVNVNQDQLEYYNISLLQVTQAIANNNLNFPTGSIKSEEREILVRLSGKYASLEDLRQAIVTTTDDGSPVYLSDVGEVFDTQEEAETISRINGDPSLGLLVKKQSDGNTVEIADLIKERMGGIEERYAEEGLSFTIAQDSSEFTLEAANHVIEDLILAVILVAVIMLFFLHSLRNALIVMVAIPVSIVSTFIVMDLLGFTLNLMTLLALSLVIGILVDDSIVVLENIHSHMERGKKAREAAVMAWREIGLSVTSITLVLIIVFLPIALVQGLVSDLLFQFSITVAFATAISLLVSFTLTPLLAARFSSLTHLSKKRWYDWPLIAFERLLNGLRSGYKSALEWSLRHKLVTTIGIFALVFASFSLLGAGFIGSEFAATGDNGEFNLELEMPKETPISRTSDVAREMEAYLLGLPEVRTVFTTVGRTSGSVSSQSTNYLAELNVKLVSAEERALSNDEYAREVKLELMQRIPGAEIKAKPVSLVGPGEAPIQIILQGSDLDQILAFSEQIKTVTESVAGTAEVETTVEGGNPELEVNIDREKMADLGLTMDVVGATMQNAFSGNDDNQYKDQDKEYDILVRLDAFDRRSEEDVRALAFLNRKGKLVELAQFATVNPTTGPSRLERQDKINSVTVESQVVNRPTGTVGEEIQNKVAELQVPEGVTISYAGDLENQAEAFGSLGFALMTSIVLVYLIMVALYDSYVYPFVTLFAIPVALIGAFLALAMAMATLSVFTFLGLIMLVGLVLKNAILIVDFANQRKAEGLNSYEAVVEGGLERLRPILMTTLAMVIAMIPIAVADGAGSEWKNGLAWVLIGGLTSSMIFTLIIVPVIYLWVDNAGAWIRRKLVLRALST